MATVLDIVDTAVKIGLGALISGITTYWVTRRSHNHDINKMAIEDRKSLVREIGSILESATEKLNLSIHSYWNNREDLSSDECLGIIEAVNQTQKAKSLAAIMGYEPLFESVSCHSKIVFDFYILISNDDQDTNQLNELVVAMNDAWKRVLNELKNAYESIWKA